MNDRRGHRDYIVKVQSGPHVTYAGLLNRAHKEDEITAIRVEIIQVPTPENGEYAIVKAAVTTKRGTYEEIGDASPRSVAMKTLYPHLLRMAATRAKARALRDALNEGGTALEEFADVDNVDGTPPAEQHSTTERQAAPTVPTDRALAVIAAGEKVTRENIDNPLALGHAWWETWAQRVEKAKGLGHPSIPSLPSTVSARNLKDESDKLVTWILAKEAEIDRAAGKSSASAQALNLG